VSATKPATPSNLHPLRHVATALKHLGRALGYALAGAVVVSIGYLLLFMDTGPELKVWHTADLDAEFTADSDARSFADYLALEDQLFAELDEEVFGRIEAEDEREINRFQRGSLADPGRWERNWNRSFELPAEAPRVGVLLVHGLSDSPYSMRSLGQQLHGAGAWVVGLRVPGHGTAPTGLRRTSWEDMDAAVRLAVVHLREQIDDRPLYLVGYSNGGALSLLYALAAIEDPALPAPDGVVLLSAEIGISALARFASWQEGLAWLTGIDQLAWTSVRPEYDPFKYQSFALNAGKQAYRLTQEIQARLARLSTAGVLDQLAPLLAFQSIVDATVSAPALVSGLYERLPPGNNELVVFDINRYVEIGPLLKVAPGEDMAAVLRSANRAFVLTIVANESAQGRAVVARRILPGDAAAAGTVTPLGVSWPQGMYSLSHVALPFPPDDPLYGPQPPTGAHIHLGDLGLRGERGLLVVPDSELLRQRWNPFYPYLLERTLGFMELAPR